MTLRERDPKRDREAVSIPHSGPDSDSEPVFPPCGKPRPSGRGGCHYGGELRIFRNDPDGSVVAMRLPNRNAADNLSIEA